MRTERKENIIKLTPYVVEIQRNVDVFGGTIRSVDKYEGLYTLTNTSLDGEDIVCIFPSKPSVEIDKVGAVVMGMSEAFKEEEKGKPIKVTMDVLLGDLGWENTVHNKNKLINDLDCFYQMNIVGRNTDSVYQMRFLSYLAVDEALEYVSFKISEVFEYRRQLNKVRFMQTTPIIATNSKYARSLYRLLHSRGAGGGRLVLAIPVQEVIQYLGLTDENKDKVYKSLSRAFKEVERLTGVKYNRLRRQDVYKQSVEKVKPQAKAKITPSNLEAVVTISPTEYNTSDISLPIVVPTEVKYNEPPISFKDESVVTVPNVPDKQTAVNVVVGLKYDGENIPWELKTEAQRKAYREYHKVSNEDY